MNKNFLNHKEYTIKNGLELITVQRDTQMASIHIGLRIGSIYEKFNGRGISHFIEHMLFKGTSKRSNCEINEAIEKRAGSYDAYTDYVSTVLSITALHDELEESTKVLSDMIMNSVFLKEEIEKEKKVILSEIKSDLDDLSSFSYLKIHQIAFDKSPLRYDVAGTEKDIEKFTQKNLKDFYHQYYVPNNCVVSIVSPYDHEKMKDMIEHYLGEWEPKKLPRATVCVQKNKCVEKKSYKRDIEQNTLLFLYTFYDLTRKEEIALEILNYKLGESSNSVLFRALREERGLSYEVYSEIDTTKWVKTLYIYTTAEQENIIEAKELILSCIKKMKTGEIDFSQKDIDHMKKVMKTSIASILEDTESIGNYLLHQKLMNRDILEFKKDLKVLQDITKEDIQHVAKKILIKPTIHILTDGE